MGKYPARIYILRQILFEVHNLTMNLSQFELQKLEMILDSLVLNESGQSVYGTSRFGKNFIKFTNKM